MVASAATPARACRGAQPCGGYGPRPRRRRQSGRGSRRGEARAAVCVAGGAGCRRDGQGGGGVINLAVRILLAAGGAIAALFVARDSPNFGVVQGMLTTVVLVCVVLIVMLWRWRKDGE